MYWLIVLSVTCASLNGTLLHKIPSFAKQNVFRFNFLCSAEWIVILMLLNKGSLHFTSETLLFGIMYGITQVLFLFFKTQAMSSGPVFITTLIGNCSLILSTAAGVIIWREPVRVIQIICIAVLLFSVFLCTFVKSNAEMTVKWKIYCVAFFVCAAAVGIIFKFFSKSEGSAYANDMMLISSFTMTLLFFLLSLTKKSTDNTEEKKNYGGFVLIAVLCGIFSCTYNRLNISLSGMFPSTVFYPSFNGGTVMLSFIMSIVFLKERPVFRQTVGLILGTCAVVALGIL